LERAAGEEDRDRDDDDEAKLRKRIVRKLARLDRSRVLVADTNVGIATVKEVWIPAHGMITTAITVRAPSDAKPGNSFRLHAMQRQHGRIVGGSTYIIAIPQLKPARAARASIVSLSLGEASRCSILPRRSCSIPSHPVSSRSNIVPTR
jgi:hypothetical protein